MPNILAYQDLKSVHKWKSSDQKCDFVPFDKWAVAIVWHRKLKKILLKIGFWKGRQHFLNLIFLAISLPKTLFFFRKSFTSGINQWIPFRILQKAIVWRSICFSGYHFFKGNACERFTSDIDFFIGKSGVKTEKSKPTLFVDLSVHDVESKNASSINVTLSLFLFSHPLAIKFNCFVLKYLLNIKIY